MNNKDYKYKVRQSLFPPSVFAVYLGVLLLMSGIHSGLIVLIHEKQMPDFVRINIPIVYWGLVAVILTLYTRMKIKKTYEKPMHALADATRKVANGDFSVYVPTLHTQEKWDYFDIMILDFNKMVEELGSIETLKTDFFSNVSHEIKTPLAVIQSNAELLQREGISQEQQKEYIGGICQATKSLSNLISNMLKLNKLEKQRIQPEPEVYDVCRQLCRCALQFEDVWERKNIEFDAEMEEQAFIKADPALMELVWNNLLSNALKFTAPGGKVCLEQRSTMGKIQIAVTDTGCGMDEETIKHIFDKFYQGDTSHAAEGNGLGLALVKRILELCDGNIQVTSEKGAGTAFIVELDEAKSDMTLNEIGADV